MEQWVYTIAVGAGTVISVLYLLRANRAKIIAEAKKINTEAKDLTGKSADRHMARLEREIKRLAAGQDKLRTELVWERKRNYQLEAWSRALAAQVVECKGRPVEYAEFRKD